MSAKLAVRPAAASNQPPAAIRVVPVPRSEPPTDDELTAAGLDAPPMNAPLLPLDLPTGAQVQRLARPRGAGRIEPSPAIGPEAVSGRARSGSAGAPEPESKAAQPYPKLAPESAEPSEVRLATRRFLATCVEVVGGFRPVSQLRSFCLPDRYTDIAENLMGRPGGPPVGRSRGLAATRTPVVGRATGSPPRAGRVNQVSPGDRVAVRRVQICETIEGVAEIAVVLARRDKVWAMAFRMERMRERWLCTHLEVV